MPRPGGTPSNGLYGEAPTERGTIFRLKVYETSRDFTVEGYNRVGKSIIWVRQGAQKG